MTCVCSFKISEIPGEQSLPFGKISFLDFRNAKCGSLQGLSRPQRKIEDIINKWHALLGAFAD
jgi:hypothetical protein